MTAIHLPGWKETIDLGRIPDREHEQLCCYVAMTIQQDLRLWKSDLSLHDVLGGWRPTDSPLEILSDWVRAKLLENPTDCELLSGQICAAFEHAEMRRECQLEAEEIHA